MLTAGHGPRVVLATLACALVAFATPAWGAITPLPIQSCQPVVFEGDGEPDVLIASDLPMQGAARLDTLQMTQAVVFALRQRGFRAGPYRVGYQVCDDSTAEAGGWDSAACNRNGRDYAANPSLIGIVGTFNSGCAMVILPLINQAPGGAIPMISPANTRPGLTRRGPGTEPDEPARSYPTGVRNYLRITAPDPFQAAANARWTKLRNRTRAFVLTDGTLYGNGQAADYAYAAKRSGITVLGPRRWPLGGPRQAALAQAIKRSRATAVYMGGIVINDGPSMVRELRNMLGPGVLIMAPDGFTPTDFVADGAGRAANNLYVSVTGPAVSRLPAEGKAFLSAFTAANPGQARIGEYPIYAAQAVQVLLDAIATSDGTRASVLRNMFATSLPTGLVGPVAFDRNGDPKPAIVTIYRLSVPPARGIARPVAVIRVPAGLVRPG